MVRILNILNLKNGYIRIIAINYKVARKKKGTAMSLPWLIKQETLAVFQQTPGKHDQHN